MSKTTALAIAPNLRPVTLAEFRNAWGWSPSIWSRLMRFHGLGDDVIFNDAGLHRLWAMIEELPE